MYDKSPDIKPIRLLLVEDEPDQAELLLRQLRKQTAAIELAVAQNLAAALERLSEENFDVIVTDLGLPDSTGAEAFLRLHARRPDVPVIVLTGMSDEAVALMAVQKGAQDYLLKDHVDGPLLVQSIRYAIERQKLLTKLERTLKEIRRLEGLIPICAWCKQIRDDRGYWKKVETYIEERTGAAFSHGICPECLKKSNPEVFEKLRKKRPDLLGRDEPDPGSPGRQVSIRVLLIEDNPDDAEIISRMMSGISGLDISLLRVDRLSIAVGLQETEQFDLILTDLGLPDSQGIETVIKVHSLYPSMPVIVMTGMHDEEMGVQAVRSGAQDYLVKGQLDSRSLLKAVRYAIERQKLLTDLGSRMRETGALEQERRTILSMFANDVWNAVASSSGLLTRILKAGAGNLREDLSVVSDQLIAVEGLMANFVEFSRMEAGEYRPVMTSFDPAAAVRKEVDGLMKRAAQKDIAVSCDLSEGPFPGVEADADMLQRVIVNILDNAVKFTDTGGKINVRVSNLEEDVLVEVRDTGIGIADDQLPQIFSAFYRANPAAGGFGLGLSLARRIIEAHGGNMRVESTPGQGSVCSFTLPRLSAFRKR